MVEELQVRTLYNVHVQCSVHVIVKFNPSEFYRADSFLLSLSSPSPGQGTTQILGYHTADGGMTPTVSQQQYNPTVDNNNNTIICPAQTTVSHRIIFIYCAHTVT